MVLAALAVLMAVQLGAATVKEIRFDGLVHMSDAVARNMLPIKPGDILSDEALSEATKSFFRLGYFDDIRIESDAGVLTFYFVEKPAISRIDTQGWKDGEDDDLDTLLMIKKGSLYDEKKIERAKKRIIDSLRDEGKIDSVVEAEIEPQENGSVAVTFRIREGEKIVIEAQEFDGMTIFDPSDFDDLIANKEHEFMGWFFGRNDGKMQLQQLEYDPLRIRDYYMQHGYLDAKVDKPFVRVDFDNYTSKMSYQINEGEPYSVGSITIEQQTEVVDNATLYEAISLEANETFNIQTFRNDIDKIKNLVADRGYAFCDIRPDYRKDEAAHTVDVFYRVFPGEKVYIRNVVISGNDRTLDRIIRRELYLGPGELYNLTDLKDSRNALGRTGYFDSTTVEEKRIDAKTMDLIVKVKEAPTGNIQIGGGYGSYGGVMYNLAVSDMNIWGSGIKVGVNLEKSQLTSNYSFNISNRRLNDSDFSGNFSIYDSHIEYDSYTVNTQGLGLGVGHRFTRHISGALSYGYSKSNYEDVNLTSVSDDYRKFYENYTKSSVTAKLTYDSTDDYYLPREGFLASQSVEYAGLQGTAEFVKTRTTFNWYQGLQSLIDLDWILRYKSRLYYVRDTGYVPYAERFYMGGMGSVRGFESYSITPRDSNDNRIGGDRTFSNSLEMSFPLIPSAKMRLAGFVDWGMIGDGRFSQYKRASYGSTVEWFSPMGPIQLIFAWPLNEEPGDDTSFFEFTIGQRF